ncbi:MAG: site-2 protease family protein [Clostridia bacterium]|nr:site-2 protease family protein [Clostridia bacterium]
MLYSILYSGGDINFLEIVMGILATLVTIAVILPFHELAHGFVAYKLGDNTAKRQGRLTFDPIAHIDPKGALCLLLVGFGWAKPVPVNMYNLKKPKRDMALVALAGPMANLIAALVGALLGNLVAVLFAQKFYDAFLYQAVMFFFEYYVSVNVGLAAFNLIPLPPLDGSKILGALLPDDLYEKQLMYEDRLAILLVVLVMAGVVDKLMSVPHSLLLNLVYTLAYLPFKPFL